MAGDLWKTDTGRRVHKFDLSDKNLPLAFVGHGKYLLTWDARTAAKLEEGYTAGLWDLETGRQVHSFQRPKSSQFILFSVGYRYLLTRDAGDLIQLWELETSREVYKSQCPKCTEFRLSPNGKYIQYRNKDNQVKQLETEAGKELEISEGNRFKILSGSPLVMDKYVLTFSSDSTMRLWDFSSGREICSLVSLRNNNWAVIDPDGRFDVGNIEELRGLQWVMPDEPVKTYPLEIFMRNYYEPRLLPRLLAADALPEIESLASLNRVQPKVTITNVTKESADTVAVTVEVENVEGVFDRKENPLVRSGVKDLRLFRDGHLVSIYPDTKEGGSIDVAPKQKKQITFSGIQLPHDQGLKDVEFSVYAFNSDDVKSETNRFTYQMPSGLSPRKGRAYLISVGVSSYENTSWNLGHAASDARRMQESVGKRLRDSKLYDDVVDVLLTSDDAGHSATKDNFRRIMEMLSGKKLSAEQTSDIPNADKLEKVTPDDLLIIFYSSHGYRDSAGKFYLYPHDIGAGQTRELTPALLEKCISSDDLSYWMRGVDGGDMVMIIDACHAAGVTGKGFKPGPMGSRGMGQLAYDKGMRILAATQEDNVALEVDFAQQQRKIEQGLLTYALVQDGIEAGLADRDKNGEITLDEWLSYAVERVPGLYKDMQTETIANANVQSSKSVKVRMKSRGGESQAGTTQQPSLFDFTQRLRRTHRTILVKKST